MANSVKNRPTIEVIVAIGKNTTILVKVDAKTAVPISLVPIWAACFLVFPISLCRKIFSKTTTELETNIPVEVDNPIIVIILKVYPKICINTNVEIIQ